jgi:predicted phage tail protein
MLTDIYLYGDLAEKYGAKHAFAVNSAPEAVRALAANYKPFFNDFRDNYYRVIIGDKEKGIEIDEVTLKFRVGNTKQIHIIPTVQGAKSGGSKALIGFALLIPFTMGASSFIALGGGLEAATASSIGASFAAAAATPLGFAGITYGGLAQFGVGLILSGLASMLSPTPKVKGYENREAVDQRASFLFNGATNRSQEGATIPLVYGRFRTGSVTLSAGTSVEQIEYITPVEGTAAVGKYVFDKGVPITNETIILNGVTFTFKNSAPGATDVTIVSGNLPSTLTNLKNKLSNSTNPAISVATYTVNSNELIITYNEDGAEGNAYTLGAGTYGGTLSGSTLEGGQDEVLGGFA